MAHLSAFDSPETLDEFLSRPTPAAVEAMGNLDGDIMVLGAGGKMGPSLAMLALRATQEAGLDRRVIAVSRFSATDLAERLQQAGIETIACDLMDATALHRLPDAPNVIYMVGMKFGTLRREAQTWAVNAFLPGIVVQQFQNSRMVLFSSGNVYPLSPVADGGCTETTPPAPVGEYAQSVLGRERIFTHFAQHHNVPGVVLRLNYAVEMRYGVLPDIARQVWTGEAIDLRMGHVNVIWQGDANACALCALALAETPPRVLNITGPETVSVRRLAWQFGELLGKEPQFVGDEQPDALLSNAGLAHARFGYPQVTLGQMVEWVAAWVRDGGPTLDRPTHFQVRDGRF